MLLSTIHIWIHDFHFWPLSKFLLFVLLERLHLTLGLLFKIISVCFILGELSFRIGLILQKSFLGSFEHLNLVLSCLSFSLLFSLKFLREHSRLLLQHFSMFDFILKSNFSLLLHLSHLLHFSLFLFNLLLQLFHFLSLFLFFNGFLLLHLLFHF